MGGGADGQMHEDAGRKSWRDRSMKEVTMLLTTIRDGGAEGSREWGVVSERVEGDAKP